MIVTFKTSLKNISHVKMQAQSKTENRRETNFKLRFLVIECCIGSFLFEMGVFETINAFNKLLHMWILPQANNFIIYYPIRVSKNVVCRKIQGF